MKSTTSGRKGSGESMCVRCRRQAPLNRKKLCMSCVKRIERIEGNREIVEIFRKAHLGRMVRYRASKPLSVADC